MHTSINIPFSRECSIISTIAHLLIIKACWRWFCEAKPGKVAERPTKVGSCQQDPSIGALYVRCANYRVLHSKTRGHKVFGRCGPDKKGIARWVGWRKRPEPGRRGLWRQGRGSAPQTYSILSNLQASLLHRLGGVGPLGFRRRT